MTFDVLSSSLIVWELLTFSVLLLLGLLIFFTLRRRNEEEAAARKVLDTRYANGELTREEYLTIRDDITRNPDA